MNTHKAFLGVLSICMFAICGGCMRKNRRHAVQVNSFGRARYTVKSVERTNTASPAYLYQSKLTDVPLPLASLPVENYETLMPSDHGMMLAYTTSMTSGDVAAYYRAEMEREGWRLLTSLEGPETTLMFEKPRKLCVISLRPAYDMATKRDNTLMVLSIVQR